MNSLVVLFLIAVCGTVHPLDKIVTGIHDIQGDGISRIEHRDGLGNVIGGFAYIDPHGIPRKTIFTSGVQGYNPVSADIPVPVEDTPEVALAKAQHMAILRAEHKRPLIPEFQDKGIISVLPLVKSSDFISLPLLKSELHGLTHVDWNTLLKSGLISIPVVKNGFLVDTPEVTAAKLEHFAAHATARANLLKL